MSSSRPKSALLIVDVQNDFCPGGELAVAGGDAVVPALNARIAAAAQDGAPVYASRDWHPAQTRHFKPFGGTWPVHCVQDTPGAAFHPALALPRDVIVVTKGDLAGADGYSAFEGHTPTGATLLEDLRERGITQLTVGGLATDYCVRASVLDARREGFDVTVLADAIRAVDVEPGDGDRAIEEMKAAGATVIATGA